MMERADQALHDAKVASRERRRGRASPSADPPATVEADSAAASGGGEELAEGSIKDAEVEPAQSPSPLLGRVRLARANPGWIFAALLLALGPVLTASLSVARMVEPLTPLAGIAIAAGSLALALGCTWAGRSGLSTRWLHLPWLAAYGLLALEIALAGPAGTALLDLIRRSSCTDSSSSSPAQRRSTWSWGKRCTAHSRSAAATPKAWRVR